MANRDYEDSQYGRPDGHYDNREPDFRDQSNRGSREWDRQSVDYRSEASGPGRRAASDYQSDARQQQNASQPHSQLGHNSYDAYDSHSSGYSDSRYGRSPQRNTLPEWNRTVGSYGRGGQASQRGDELRRTQDWDRDSGRSGGPSPQWRSYAQDWSDHGRDPWRERGYASQQTGYGQEYRGGGNPFERQEHNRQDWNRTVGGGSYGQPSASYGQGSYARSSYGGDRDESWGEQIRHAGEQVVNRVKRAFRGPKGYKRSDERIREDVNDRLAQQYDFDPSEVEVQVQSGEVTLSGTVRSRHEKFIAEELADEISGVTEVHNQIRVKREDTFAQGNSAGSTSSLTGTQTREASRNGSASRS